MKKNLFDVNSDEIKRILTLHEERTKSQYLNVISETLSKTQAEIDSETQSNVKVGQSGPVQYITSKRNCFDNSRCVPEKTKFVPLTKKVAIAYGVKLNKQESPVNIKFYCKAYGGQFAISYKNGEMSVENELLKNTLLKTVCGHDANITNDVKSFNQTANAEKTTLTDEQKLDRALLCGHNSWEEYKNSKWTCTKQLDTVNITPKKVTQQAVTPKTQQVNRQKQFTQNTVVAINNVQTALGVAPTGQLKNSDIDTLLVKLQ